MSANVWMEEVNTGLKNEIASHVFVCGAQKGEKTPIIPSSVIIRKPEEDFKIEVFPCVSIYNKSYEHDTFRQERNQVKMALDRENKVVEMEDAAVTFNLFYQIDFWARYQTDMDMMTRTWLYRHYRQFNLPVIDDGGVPRSCNCLLNGQVVKSDLTLNKERLFHSIINYEIWVALDEETRYNKPMVIERIINANIKKGESEDGKTD